MVSKNGQTTFNFRLIVPADKSEEVEVLLATHAAWMRETHSLEADGRVHLVDFHWARSEELNNQIDPSQGTSGNILYALTEVYVEKDGPDQHMAAAMQWESFQAVASTLLEYGKGMVMGGAVIHSMDG
jgi:hypothetical protein